MRNVQGKVRRVAGALVIAGSAGLALVPAPAHAVTNVCVARTASTPGNVRWQLRQVSGLASLAASPGVLFAHNDRGIRDNPNPAGEDVTDAAVWAITESGSNLARLRLVDSAGDGIPYYDTEAISRDPQGRLVLADTGTNVDNRVTVAVYRFTPPAVTTGQTYAEGDVPAEVIPLAYYANATTTTRTKLNVEAMAIDGSGNAWFIPRSSGRPYAYMATASALNQASGGTAPARAVRSTRLSIDGPVTDAAFSPDGTMLLVKTTTDTYAYDLRGTTVAAALGTTPCTVATANRAKSPGYGEAVVARNDGSFVTVAEGSKSQYSGLSSALWSFAA